MTIEKKQTDNEIIDTEVEENLDLIDGDPDVPGGKQVEIELQPGQVLDIIKELNYPYGYYENLN